MIRQGVSTASDEEVPDGDFELIGVAGIVDLRLRDGWNTAQMALGIIEMERLRAIGLPFVAYAITPRVRFLLALQTEGEVRSWHQVITANLLSTAGNESMLGRLYLAVSDRLRKELCAAAASR